LKDFLHATIAARHLGYEDQAVLANARGPWRGPALWVASRPFRGRLDRHLPPASWGRKMLDVGCGAGVSLDHAKRYGWDTYGLEISEAAVEAAQRRGHTVVLGRLAQASFDPESFDVVRLWHVLEHLPDPREALVTIHRLLRPGGRLWLEVPNMRSAAAWIFRSRWFNLDAPRHLYAFSPGTLLALLRESGFQPVAQVTYQTPQDLERSVHYVVADLGFGMSGRLGRWLSLGIVVALTPLSWILTRLGLGDRLRVTAVREDEHGRRR
jgi:SAM-dependent methyltransferase